MDRFTKKDSSAYCDETKQLQEFMPQKITTERLTDKNHNACKQINCDCCELCGDEQEECGFYQLHKKLQQYENTGLTPQETIDLKKNYELAISKLTPKEKP